MQTQRASILTLSLMLPFTAVAMADASDWAKWRGPDGTGFVKESNPPTTWSETDNIRWKVAIPGGGHASPIVYRDRVYLMTAVKVEAPKAEDGGPGDGVEQLQPSSMQDRRQGRGQGRRGGGRGPTNPTDTYEYQVMALNRADGSTMWKTTVHKAVPHEGIHPTSTFASNSPLTDGEHIFAYFGSMGVHCLTMAGDVVWSKDLGDMRIRNAFGEGASPAVHGDTLVVPWDHEGDSFVVAFNKSTGDEKWRVERDEATTWSTPAITKVNGEMQAILPGNNFTIGYRLSDGKEIWRCGGLTSNVIPTPIVANGMIYLMSGFRGSSVLAVRLDKAIGDITGNTDAIAWTHNRSTPYVPSPMLAGDRLYFLGSNNAILSCFNAKTGEAHYLAQRLDDVRNVYSSIVGAGGYLYVCGREGGVAVIKEGPEFEQIATNQFDEGINATPAIVDNEIYLRTDKHLYCIARD